MPSPCASRGLPVLQPILGAAPMSAARYKRSPPCGQSAKRASLRRRPRFPRIDQLHGDVLEAVDIAGRKRNVAADCDAGNLHIRDLKGPASAATVSAPLCGSERGETIEVQHAATEQIVQCPVDASFKHAPPSALNET